MTKSLEYDRMVVDVPIIDEDGTTVKAYLGVFTDPVTRMICAVRVDIERNEEKTRDE